MAILATTYAEMLPLLKEERARGRSIALCNGCFDLLHVGHVRLLQASAKEADVLVVALNTDESIRINKGPERPLVPLLERMEVIGALGCVAYVTSFAEPTADPLLLALQPDVHCKGTDWKAEEVPERATVLGYGGRIAICGDAKEHSSSELARRLGS